MQQLQQQKQQQIKPLFNNNACYFIVGVCCSRSGGGVVVIAVIVVIFVIFREFVSHFQCALDYVAYYNKKSELNSFAENAENRRQFGIFFLYFRQR